MLFSFPISKNFAVEIDLLYKVRSYRDGITFFECNSSLDYSIGDHHPRFYLRLTIFSITIIHAEIYDVRHTEDKDYVDTTAIGHATHGVGQDVRILLMQPYGKKRQSQPQTQIMKRGRNEDIRFHVTLDRNPDKIQICDGQSDRILTQEEHERLFVYLKKYRIPFLNFWHRPYMCLDELHEQIELIDIAENGLT
jgi:hypothetical protein